MNPARNTSFLREVGLGLVLSLAGSAAFAALAFVMPAPEALRLVVTVLALTYAALVVARSEERAGRIVALFAWALFALATWFVPLTSPALIGITVAGLWLTRALLGRTSIVTALLDLGLSFLALGFAAWAALRADGVFLPLWCFFLVQALHVAVPGLAARLSTARAAPGHGSRSASRYGVQATDGLSANDAPDRRFEHAFNAADEALQRLAARR